MKNTILSALVLIILLSTPVFAQQHPNDNGIADTVDMVFSASPDYTTNQLQVQMDLYVNIDVDTLIGFTMGFYWENDNLTLDSATAEQYIYDNFGIGPFFYEDGDIAVSNANNHFLLGASVLMGTGLVPTGARRLFASYYFTLSDWQPTDSLVLDTLEFNGGSEWAFVRPGQIRYNPLWTGRKVIYDSTYTPPSNLVLSDDSLHFEINYNAGNPPSQTFDIMSDGDPLSFNIVEDADWIIPTPLSGTTDRTITVNINTLTLPVGDYIDTLVVESGVAANSPQYVVVTLSIIEPPPVIWASPSFFNFNAIVDGANPDPKILTIKNTGGSILEWNLYHTEVWLTLVPDNGTDSGDVTVSVDITGMGFGEYYDTILVVDPDAVNDSVKIPVTLALGSNLPLIIADSASNWISIKPGGTTPVDFTIGIRNGGIGTLNFTIQESSDFIIEVNPDTSTAPDEIVVSIDPEMGYHGLDYFDTLWVYSDEAINSPYPVELIYHFVSYPADLYVFPDTIALSVFECDMGNDPLPTTSFQIGNSGGDVLWYKLYYESDYFQIFQDSGVATQDITVYAQFLDLPLGTYYDTIGIWAPLSEGMRSKEVILQYNVIEGIEVPEIFTGVDTVVIPTQENAGPVLGRALNVLNDHGGCMSFSVSEDVDWLFADGFSSEVPNVVQMIVNSSGFPFGEYVDSMYILSDTASNSPYKQMLKMQVWRFYGDWNWDAKVNVVDLVWCIEYLFNLGHRPIPEFIVGDVNCNAKINIEDLTYLVDYLYGGGEIPCGNPYKK